MSYFNRLFDKGWKKLEENKFLRAGVCFSLAVFLLVGADEKSNVWQYLASAAYFVVAVYSLFPKTSEKVGIILAGVAVIGCMLLLGQLVNPMLPTINPIALAIIVGAIIIALSIRAKK